MERDLKEDSEYKHERIFGSPNDVDVKRVKKRVKKRVERVERRMKT